MKIVILLCVLAGAGTGVLCRSVTCSKSEEEWKLEDEEQAAYLIAREAAKAKKKAERADSAHS